VWYVGGGDLTGALQILKNLVVIITTNHLLLQPNPELFEILVLAYPDCAQNWLSKPVLLSNF